MKRFFLVAATALLFVVVPKMVAQKGATSGGAVKIATADVEKIAKELPEAIEADKRLTEVRKKCIDTLGMIENKYKEKLEAYKKGKAMMTSDAQKKEEEELLQLQQQYGMYQEQKFGNGGELAKVRDEMLKPILQKIQQAISAVAKKNGYNFVFDKTASGVLIYSDESSDITFKVIDFMKNNK